MYQYISLYIYISNGNCNGPVRARSGPVCNADAEGNIVEKLRYLKRTWITHASKYYLSTWLLSLFAACCHWMSSLSLWLSGQLDIVHGSWVPSAHSC